MKDQYLLSSACLVTVAEIYDMQARLLYCAITPLWDVSAALYTDFCYTLSLWMLPRYVPPYYSYDDDDDGKLLHTMSGIRTSWRLL
mmetsp:Transcript_22730/g.40709  ORF Transcript_22730/g.40709 Transcript_22730/m.40709 type:complete len:86 (-) Transcript_22730:27-284(-)